MTANNFQHCTLLDDIPVWVRASDGEPTTADEVICALQGDVKMLRDHLHYLEIRSWALLGAFAVFVFVVATHL